MTHPPQLPKSSAPGQYPEAPQPPRKLMSALRVMLRVIGTAFGVLFLIIAISAFRTETIWLPWVSAFAIAWALLYFFTVAPWLKRRTTTTAPPQPGRRTRSALRKAAIGVVVPFLIVIVTGIVDMTVHPDEYEALGADTATSSKLATPSASPTAGPTAASETMTEQPGPVAFTESMVRAHGVTKDDQGGQSNVRFVAGTEDPKPESTERSAA